FSTLSLHDALPIYDVLALLPRRTGGRALRTADRPGVRAGAARLSAPAAGAAADLERGGGDGPAAVRRDVVARHDFQVRAHAGGRPGVRLLPAQGRARRDRTADARLLAADVRDREEAAGIRNDVPDHHPGTGLRRHAVQALGPAQQVRRPAATGAAGKVERDRRRPDLRLLAAGPPGSGGCADPGG